MFWKNLPVVKQYTALRSKLDVLKTLLDNIQVHEDYVEIILPDNVMITSNKHLAIRTPNGKLLLNPRIPNNRKLDRHVQILIQEHQKLLEK